MIKNYFSGHNPSHYEMNSIVKSFILSEGFFWSGYNFIYPLLTIFVVENIVGGTIELAAAAVSVYMIARVMTELITGRLLEGETDRVKLLTSIGGIIFVGISFLSYAIITEIFFVYLLQIGIGIGLGVASPAKYSLFTQHLDKKRSSNEWSIYDAVSFIGMAMASALGGFIAQAYGFKLLFIIAGIFILLGAFPYILLLFTPQKIQSHH